MLELCLKEFIYLFKLFFVVVVARERDRKLLQLASDFNSTTNRANQILELILHARALEAQQNLIYAIKVQVARASYFKLKCNKNWRRNLFFYNRLDTKISSFRIDQLINWVWQQQRAEAEAWEQCALERLNSPARAFHSFTCLFCSGLAICSVCFFFFLLPVHHLRIQVCGLELASLLTATESWTYVMRVIWVFVVQLCWSKGVQI